MTRRAGAQQAEHTGVEAIESADVVDDGDIVDIVKYLSDGVNDLPHVDDLPTMAQSYL